MDERAAEGRSRQPRPRNGAGAAARAGRDRADDPVIPVVPFDETDAAWGDYPSDSDEWLRQQRPPHHGG